MPRKTTNKAKRQDASLFNLNIANRVRAARAKLGLTTTDLAETIGMSQAQISRLENGMQGFRSGTLHKIADALHVSARFLVAGDHKTSPASVIKEPEFYGPGMPKEVVTALQSEGYRKFLMKSVKIFKNDDAAFSVISSMVRRAKVKYWP